MCSLQLVLWLDKMFEREIYIYTPAYTSSVNEINPANELWHHLVWWEKTICSYDICLVFRKISPVLWGNIDSASQASVIQ